MAALVSHNRNPDVRSLICFALNIKNPTELHSLKRLVLTPQIRMGLRCESISAPVTAVCDLDHEDLEPLRKRDCSLLSTSAVLLRM